MCIRVGRVGYLYCFGLSRVEYIRAEYMVGVGRVVGRVEDMLGQSWVRQDRVRKGRME